MAENFLLSIAPAAALVQHSSPLHILLIGLAPRLANELASARCDRRCRVDQIADGDLLQHLTTPLPAEAVILVQDQSDILVSPQLLAKLRRLHIPIMAIGGPDRITALPDWLYDAPPEGAGVDEVLSRARLLVRMARHARRVRTRIRKLKRAGRHLQDNYEQIDNELLLAGQLQRDFLPKQLPNVPNLRFAALMRPYSWVSGDIYDIFRIDEDHVGMYVADAVGHGVAAGLLTMFTKQALVAKRVTKSDYHILPPAEVLHNLNQSMVTHDLPNCQYVTICYAVVNFRTMRLQVARAAHPAPLLVDGNNQIHPIESDPACVIGVFKDQSFSQVELDLQPGHKLLLFSDGLEEAFGRGPARHNRWVRILQHNAGRDIHTIFTKLEKAIDRTRGSLHPEDDITAVGLEVPNPSTDRS